MPAEIILPASPSDPLASAHLRQVLAGAVAQRLPGGLRGAAWQPLGGPRFHLAASGRWGWVRQRLLVQADGEPRVGTWLGSYERAGDGWALIDATCAVDDAPSATRDAA